MNLLIIFTTAFISIFGHVSAEFPDLFGKATLAPTPEATTQTVNGPIQRLLVCQAIDSQAELQKLASAVAAMDQQIKQSAPAGKDKSLFDFAKFKEVVTTMMTTLATETPTTPSYSQDGNVGYPKYFFANMSGSDNGYNGNLFPMEIDAWYQPGYSQSYSSYSRPRPRPRYRPRPRVRPSYRKYGARRPAAMQPMQGKPIPRKPLLPRGRFSPRSIDAEPDYVDDPYVSLLEPLRPAIRQFLSIAREEEELLDNELDYVDVEEEEHHQPETRGIRKAPEHASNASLKDNKERYATPN